MVQQQQIHQPQQVQEEVEKEQVTMPRVQGTAVDWATRWERTRYALSQTAERLVASERKRLVSPAWGPYPGVRRPWRCGAISVCCPTPSLTRERWLVGVGARRTRASGARRRPAR